MIVAILMVFIGVGFYLKSSGWDVHVTNNYFIFLLAFIILIVIILIWFGETKHLIWMLRTYKSKPIPVIHYLQRKIENRKQLRAMQRSFLRPNLSLTDGLYAKALFQLEKGQKHKNQNKNKNKKHKR